MGKINTRMPAVAGTFYPSSPAELRQQLESFIKPGQEKLDVIACLLPHAGYMYSGAVAGATVSRINVKGKLILLGPNHTGYGAPLAIMTQGIWQTPLGEVKIDTALAQNILNGSQYLEDDSLAHQGEHALEVILPFFQYYNPDIEIVPIVVASDELKALEEIGKDIAAAIIASGGKESVIIAASSDMTHYESESAAAKKDREAIGAMLELNPGKLMDRVSKLRISMCGYAPVACMLQACRQLGAKKAELIKYQTSGEVTKDTSQVVGYAGMVFY